jgi:hypothetical protein
MYRNTLALCAESVLLDQQTNNVSLINVVEEITPDEFPVVMPRVSWLFIFERDPSDDPQPPVAFVVRLGGRELLRVPVEVNFEDKMRNRAMLAMSGLPIASEGVLEGELTLGGVAVTVRTIVRRATRSDAQQRHEVSVAIHPTSA